MPLYSTGTQINTNKGKLENGPGATSDSEVGTYTELPGATSWCYLFIHHNKVETVSKVLRREHYPVFVHKSIIYKREHKRIRKDECPTISGLVFVQGDGGKIQTVLKDNFFSLYLVKDCSSGEIAVIPDRVMQSFMRLSTVDPTRIRFMPHTFDYYSVGNPLIRITSGVLSGLEGYRIRISRDKCFVTSFGGMTVAIGGIYKESFENLDEYLLLRREQLKKVGSSLPHAAFTPLQQEMDCCFFTPQTPLDVMAIADGLVSWVERMKADVSGKCFDEAAEIALFLLDEVGSRFRTVYNDARVGDLKEIIRVCEVADEILTAILQSVDVSTDLKEVVAAGRESLMIRYPFLPIDSLSV